MRNAKVTHGLHKNYRELTKSSNVLTVKCVSSDHYETNKYGFEDDEIPLSVDATGIPNLRHLFSGFPAASKRETFDKHLNWVRDTFASMGIWGSKPSKLLCEEIREVVAKPLEVHREHSLNVDEG